MDEQTNLDRAIKLARGVYQRNVVRGAETLGGSSLRGKAKRYSGRYQRSAYAILDRVRVAGIPHRIDRGPRGGWHSATLTILDSWDGVDE